jgi:activator of HSP90 ATPase
MQMKSGSKVKPGTKAGARAKGAAKGKGPVKTKTIKQSVTFKAEPGDVYEVLMDQKKHAAFTGAPAKISRKVGGAFSAHGGYCSGIQLALEDGKKIVQSWRGSDWPKDHFSTATFAISKAAGGAKLAFTQTGVPEKQYASIKSGWIEHYWQPMKEMLEGGT